MLPQHAEDENAISIRLGFPDVRGRLRFLKTDFGDANESAALPDEASLSRDSATGDLLHRKESIQGHSESFKGIPFKSARDKGV